MRKKRIGNRSASDNPFLGLTSRNNLYLLGPDCADISRPRDAGLDTRTYKRCEPLRSRRMKPEQDNSRKFRRTFALKGNLPEVLVER